MLRKILVVAFLTSLLCACDRYENDYAGKKESNTKPAYTFDISQSH